MFRRHSPSGPALSAVKVAGVSVRPRRPPGRALPRSSRASRRPRRAPRTSRSAALAASRGAPGRAHRTNRAAPRNAPCRPHTPRPGWSRRRRARHEWQPHAVGGMYRRHSLSGPALSAAKDAASRSGLGGLPGERFRDHRARLGDPVERHERAEARPLRLAEKHLVERAEPIAQHHEVLLADRIHLALDGLGVGALDMSGKPTPLAACSADILLRVLPCPPLRTQRLGQASADSRESASAIIARVSAIP